MSHQNYSQTKGSLWYRRRNTEIVEAYERGETPQAIADRWRLDVATVKAILKGYHAEPREWTPRY